ncbi:MAG: thioredoxin domain-containing protein [Deltaproteobacteria bacterium]|jgi:protein-disulfide isomerase|nr:thioredoxin domain-containing protein [Deltaproteobacteria bacterium]
MPSREDCLRAMGAAGIEPNRAAQLLDFVEQAKAELRGSGAGNLEGRIARRISQLVEAERAQSLKAARNAALEVVKRERLEGNVARLQASGLSFERAVLKKSLLQNSAKKRTKTLSTPRLEDIMKLWIAPLCFLLFSAATACAASKAEDDFAGMLRQALKKHPEIVLDVLREHSESVLDIAQQGSQVRRKKNMESQWREDIKQPKKVAAANRPVLGPANAPVTVVAFSDFTCSYCQQAAEVLDRIVRARPQDVKVLFKHMPRGKDSGARLAAEYFVAASFQNDRAPWLLHNSFFAEPERLSAEAQNFAAKAAEQAGLDMKKLAADLKGKKTAAILEEDQADAKRLHVEGTPFFLVNNLTIRGAVSYDIFNAAVDMALTEAGK